MQIPITTSPVGLSYVHAAIVALVLFSVTVPIALRTARREQQPWLAQLIMASLALHFLGSCLQVLVVRVAYNNSADFNLYNSEGARLAATWRTGTFSIDGIRGQIPGTGMVSVVTGAVYSVFGVDQLGGFLVFSWLSLLGLIAFYMAFRTALRAGDHKRYAAVIFLLPSLLYWPAAVGKEALMMPALGLMALGAAYILVNRWSGVVPMAAGILIGGSVRPHEVALLFGAFGVAMLTRRTVRRSLVTPVRWAVTLAVIVVFGVLLARVTASFLGISRLNATALVDTMTDTNSALQGEGDSSHSSWSPNPLYLPFDVYLVLFKPLPFEVTSATQVFAALENLTIMALILRSWRSLLSLPRQMRESPFVVMCVVFSIGFIYIFSALGNVGLLARERTLLFPLFFVLIALPTLGGRSPLSESSGAAGTRPADVPIRPPAAIMRSRT